MNFCTDAKLTKVSLNYIKLIFKLYVYKFGENNS